MVKARKIREILPKQEVGHEGWLCVEEDPLSWEDAVVFYNGKPEPHRLKRESSTGLSKGQWYRRGGWSERWGLEGWKGEYGDAALPKPGKREYVKLVFA